MSWKPEVHTAGDPEGVFTGNALRFATEEEALKYVRDLMARWTAVADYRVVESDDPVNYAIRHDNVLRKVEDASCEE